MKSFCSTNLFRITYIPNWKVARTREMFRGHFSGCVDQNSDQFEMILCSFDLSFYADASWNTTSFHGKKSIVVLTYLILPLRRKRRSTNLRKKIYINPIVERKTIYFFKKSSQSSFSQKKTN